MVDPTVPVPAPHEPASPHESAATDAHDPLEATRELPPIAPIVPAPAAGPERQILGVLALVFGVIGLVASAVAAGFVFGIAAAILGHLSLRSEPAARGMAITGLVTGYVSIGISVAWGIILLATILIPLFAVGLWVGTGTFGG